MITPDYQGGGITNLMASVAQGLGGRPSGYPPTPLVDPAALVGAANVLLLVIDGLGYDYLQRHGAGGFLQSNCQGRLTSVCPSTTASAIPTFLFGVPPQQHGFTGWFGYYRELGSVLAVLPFRPRHGGAPLGTQEISPRALCGREPLSESLAVPSLAVMPEWIADSDFNRAFQGPARLARYRDMETFFDCCAAGLRGGGWHYVYAYWPEFDALAHEFGVASPQVAEHLARLEAGLERLQRRIAGSDTLVLVTADHGMIDSPPERTILLGQHPELADSLVLPLCGEPRFAYAYLRSGREQAFREYITGELAHAIDLHPSGRLLEQGWFGSGPPHPRLHQRIGDYALVLRDNYKIKDFILGEHPHLHIGVHGGVSQAEMYVPLIRWES
ncbi:MAG: alkaline phosphatase family protein [Candidatus Sedimenticola endophacoides]